MNNYKEFMEKVERIRVEGGVDLSIGEDLSLAVMNLISLEEHLFFTAEKTGREEYFDTSAELRAMRKNLLQKLMPEHEGETWCVSKHLLSATMRLIETGNKLHSEGEKTEAKEMYDSAYRVYSIFWALKLKLVNVTEVGQIAEKEKLSKQDIINKLAHCCDE